jgi:hypothetical protein
MFVGEVEIGSLAQQLQKFVILGVKIKKNHAPILKNDAIFLSVLNIQ